MSFVPRKKMGYLVREECLLRRIVRRDGIPIKGDLLGMIRVSNEFHEFVEIFGGIVRTIGSLRSKMNSMGVARRNPITVGKTVMPKVSNAPGS